MKPKWFKHQPQLKLPSPGPRAAKLMRTHNGLQAQPNSIHAIIDTSRRDQRHGLALNWCVREMHPTKLSPQH